MVQGYSLLEGAHDLANVFVLCISHCLVLKQVLKEKMRETIGDIFYEDLLQVTFDIRTGNTKDGWKKARYKPTTLLLIWNTE